MVNSGKVLNRKEASREASRMKHIWKQQIRAVTEGSLNPMDKRQWNKRALGDWTTWTLLMLRWDLSIICMPCITIDRTTMQYSLPWWSIITWHYAWSDIAQINTDVCDCFIWLSNVIGYYIICKHECNDPCNGLVSRRPGRIVQFI